MAHQRADRNAHPIAQREMPQNVGTATNGAIRANHCATCHTRAASHRRVFADMHVVGDLDEVIELDPVFNHGIAQRAPVDTGIGSDFYIVPDTHRAELFDFFPRLIGAGGKTKTIRTNHHAGMQNAACANGAIFAHGHAGFQHRIRSDTRSFFHHAQRADGSGRMNIGFGVNHRARMNAFVDRAFPELGEFGEVKVRIVRNNAITTRHCDIPHCWRNHDAARAGGLQLGLVFRVA